MKSVTRLVTLLFIGLTLFLSGCGPTKYGSPVKMFNDSMDGSKQIYFNQLMVCHDSYVEFYNMNLELDSLTIVGHIGSDDYEKARANLLEMTKSSNIPEVSFKIRNRAFKIIEYYGRTLSALASDEKTDALQAELAGFSEDTMAFAETLETVSELSESLEFLESATEWAGYLGDAISVIEELVELVAEYYREKALKEAIIQSHPKIVDLIGILKSEAVTAAQFREKNFHFMSKNCNATLKMNLDEDITKQYLISNICNDIQIAQGMQLSPQEIDNAFTLVINSHAEMEKMAKGSSLDEVEEKIRSFREQLEVITTKFELLTN